MGWLDDIGLDFSSIVPDYSPATSGNIWDTLTNAAFDGDSGTATSPDSSSGSWWDSITGALKTPGVLPALQTSTGLLTSYLGSGAQQSAISKALGQLRSAYGMAGTTAADQFNKALALTQPYREAGTAILPTLGAYAAGLSPGRATLQGLVDKGMYDWQAQQLNKQLNAQLAARGRYDSGAGLKVIGDAQRALGAQEAEKQFGRQLTLENMDYGRLLDLANMGMGAASGGAGIAQNQGTTLANLYTGLGQAQAQGTSAMGNATASMYGGANKALQGGLANLYSQMGF